ncbi:hypothetical protein BDV18DRAFT_75396 [Aspergillus unguis]
MLSALSFVGKRGGGKSVGVSITCPAARDSNRESHQKNRWTKTPAVNLVTYGGPEEWFRDEPLMETPAIGRKRQVGAESYERDGPTSCGQKRKVTVMVSGRSAHETTSPTMQDDDGRLTRLFGQKGWSGGRLVPAAESSVQIDKESRRIFWQMMV